MSKERKSLQELYAQMMYGDHDAFTEIYRRLTGGLVLFFRRHGIQEHAEMLMQETWAAVWKAIHEGHYDPTRASLSTFAYAVAQKILMRHRQRSAKRMPFYSLQEEEFAEKDLFRGEDFIEVLSKGEMLDRIGFCLACSDEVYSLTMTERLIVLGTADGKSERHLASKLNQSNSEVHRLKLRAYKKLRHCFRVKGWEL